MVKEAYPFFILSSIIIFFIYFGKLFLSDSYASPPFILALVESCLKHSPIA